MQWELCAYGLVRFKHKNICVMFCPKYLLKSLQTWLELSRGLIINTCCRHEQGNLRSLWKYSVVSLLQMLKPSLKLAPSPVTPPPSPPPPDLKLRSIAAAPLLIWTLCLVSLSPAPVPWSPVSSDWLALAGLSRHRPPLFPNLPYPTAALAWMRMMLKEVGFPETACAALKGWLGHLRSQ